MRTRSVSNSSKERARQSKVWIEDKFLEISENPEKRAKAFKIGWIIAYLMLLLGAFLIIWAFLN